MKMTIILTKINKICLNNTIYDIIKYYKAKVLV